MVIRDGEAVGRSPLRRESYASKLPETPWKPEQQDTVKYVNLGGSRAVTLANLSSGGHLWISTRI